MVLRLATTRGTANRIAAIHDRPWLIDYPFTFGND